MRSILLFILSVFLATGPVAAQETSFKQFNPDVDKYEFAKSFISSLGYYARVSGRLALEDKAAVESRTDIRSIRACIDHRTLDNTDLRIARNYLVRYFKSSNGLIRRVAIDSVATYDRLIGMSVQERTLWQEFEDSRLGGRASSFDEVGFGSKQVLLARDKKEIAKELILQANFVTKVLLSSERCATEDCKELALTQGERYRLAKKLDSLSEGNLDWGVKPGQSTVQACMAILREVLEDPVYSSRP
ncbi:MAG: hypothetical protein HGA80_06565 [Candidatus Omnitrophica bacterium]|nr:hypothetical protein [Candidatus Omnitrophota bacterium]